MGACACVLAVMQLRAKFTKYPHVNYDGAGKKYLDLFVGDLAIQVTHESVKASKGVERSKVKKWLLRHVKDGGKGVLVFFTSARAGNLSQNVKRNQTVSAEGNRNKRNGDIVTHIMVTSVTLPTTDRN